MTSLKYPTNQTGSINNLICNYVSAFSFLECASLCAINSSCSALIFDKPGSICSLGNRTDFRIQANQTLWNEAIPVHVKEGVQSETNGISYFKLGYMTLSYKR
jgi:hypothetical protein